MSYNAEDFFEGVVKKSKSFKDLLKNIRGVTGSRVCAINSFVGEILATQGEPIEEGILSFLCEYLAPRRATIILDFGGRIRTIAGDLPENAKLTFEGEE